ncbi:uncharacterized protein LOC110636745 isoform X2 [Hevea brasiliensis]|uniref:uncharacterized protein LOC110636745 isoform X2 n=1 Tax=Hevea brasiliensis TaxID=3981 RepID=UPI0025D094FE|nr:uncharacterized protein LOC110636745 isoform X2 [Hevea brasiliensis]
MGWGKTYIRRLRIFAAAMMIYLDYKAIEQIDKWTINSNRDALWDKAHERNAKRLANLVIELEGFWVKLGQYLSTRADVIPHAYISHLKQLQDALPPRPIQQVYQTIEKELGKSIDDLFSYFNRTPLATASIAQVHRAMLNNGKKVVVKVQHEGIKIKMLEDLKIAKSIVDWIAWSEPQYNFNPMMDEWRREVPKEFDFNIEAENTRIVASNLCKKNNDDGKPVKSVDVLIPEVIQSSEKVLILEYMDGIRLKDNESLEAYGVDKQKVVEEITRAYAHQIYIDGFFNADPHPGNFLVSKEPPHRPVLLDFGFAKKISTSTKQALAKLFLASAEEDHVGLLSAFAELGLRLRLDIPDQAMAVTNLFFRTSTPASEASENLKYLAEQKSKQMKAIQEKMKLNEKEFKRFDPIDAFPGDVVIFSRVLTLLRGLSSTMNARITFQEIFKPFAEFALLGNVNKGPAVNAQWIYNAPSHSDVEIKLRKLLVELGKEEKILGIQVCAYKDGNVIIDTAAGVLGRYDPRPVQPDTLFPVFSVTKGITAGMIHWLIDNGKVKLDENVADVWPEFGTKGKDQIKVCHVLNHTSGLHNSLANLKGENPLLMCDWEECMNQICTSVPETAPGQEQLYHYLSFGWLCGGIIEHASSKKFQEILEEAIIRPLKIEGELYVGIPPGVESRLASLTVDMNNLSDLLEITSRPDLPSSFQPTNISQLVTTMPALFNLLNVRRAIIPAANGHCSARALARYYATLVAGGIIPPPPSTFSKPPPLGSHPHIPQFTSEKASKRGKSKTSGGSASNATASAADNFASGDDSQKTNVERIFTNPRIHDAFLGVGEYEKLAIPNGKFGLGFRRFILNDGSFSGFGHSGMGGSTGFCDIKNRFAIAVTLNKMSFGGLTRQIIQLVCSELNVPLPEDFSISGNRGPDVLLNIGGSLIN